MRAVVMKFGGSSVVDAAAIQRVTAIVGRERDRGGAPVVGVSAFGGVPDKLLGLAETASRGHADEVRTVLEALRKRHLEEAARLSADRDPALIPAVLAEFDQLDATFRTIDECRAADPR